MTKQNIQVKKRTVRQELHLARVGYANALHRIRAAEGNLSRAVARLLQAHRDAGIV